MEFAAVFEWFVGVVSRAKVLAHYHPKVRNQAIPDRCCLRSEGFGVMFLVCKMIVFGVARVVQQGSCHNTGKTCCYHYCKNCSGCKSYVTFFL